MILDLADSRHRPRTEIAGTTVGLKSGHLDTSFMISKQLAPDDDIERRMGE
jgi:hypothetical protein